LTGARAVLPVDRIAALALAHAHAALLLLAEAEVWDLDRGHGDGDEVLALQAGHLTVRDVLAQIALDASVHDVAKAAEIAVDAAEL
jgi:hypothetical protein